MVLGTGAAEESVLATTIGKVGRRLVGDGAVNQSAQQGFESQGGCIVYIVSLPDVYHWALLCHSVDSKCEIIRR
jgi:hypothetical protein